MLRLAEVYIARGRRTDAGPLIDEALAMGKRLNEVTYNDSSYAVDLSTAGKLLFQICVGCAKAVKLSSRLRSGRTKVATARSALRPLARQGHLVGTVTGFPAGSCFPHDRLHPGRCDQDARTGVALRT